jgi:mRNA interferase HicA
MGFANRTQLCEYGDVRGSEFLRKLHALARRNGVPLHFVAAKGKGSHGTVYFGALSTVLKDQKKELGIGLLRAMCRDLGYRS